MRHDVVVQCGDLRLHPIQEWREWEAKKAKRRQSRQTRERDLAVCPNCKVRTAQVTPKRGERVCMACGECFKVIFKRGDA